MNFAGVRSVITGPVVPDGAESSQVPTLQRHTRKQAVQNRRGCVQIVWLVP